MLFALAKKAYITEWTMLFASCVREKKVDIPFSSGAVKKVGVLCPCVK